VSIHSGDPFATPAGARSPARQLRGRLPSPVTLWTAAAPGDTGTGSAATRGWAGLTVSSTLVVDGDPARLVGLLDEESDLWEALRASGRFVVLPLAAGDRQLADRFAGLMPAPGGPFEAERWRAGAFGPVPRAALTWAGCELEGSRPYGYSLLVEARIVEVEVGPDAAPLLHYRGRYRELR
jgi:3-hydroxy-9,10-secoandrosta-1,3,5(10)-triene-9,17-dione monooxygenase reductase component